MIGKAGFIFLLSAFCALADDDPFIDPTINELIRASIQSDREAIERLIARGADINQDLNLPNGYKPIHLAAREGTAEFVTFLLNNGADRFAIDKDQKRPIDIAIQWERPGICIALALPEDHPSRKENPDRALVKYLLQQFCTFDSNKIVFVAMNGSDPPSDILKELKLEEVRPISERTKKEKTDFVIEITFAARNKDKYEFKIDSFVGTKHLSGGVTTGEIDNKFGYWVATISDGYFR